MTKQPDKDIPVEVEYWIHYRGLGRYKLPPGIVCIPTPQQTADVIKISFDNYCLNAGVYD